MSNPIDSFLWHELVTPDAEQALDFYGQVVGWTARPFSGATGSPYRVLEAGGKGMGGIFEITPAQAEAGMAPGWVGYIHAADVDARVERVKRAGGTVHRPPEDIPGVGRFAPVSDPQGAGFILFQPTPPPGKVPEVATGAGTVGWNELVTTDWKAAFAFYSELFGWKRSTAMDMGPMGTYQLFSAGNGDIGGMMNAPSAERPHWTYYFKVESIDAALGRVKAKRGIVLHGPSEVPGGLWILQARDPQGALFALVGPR